MSQMLRGGQIARPFAINPSNVRMAREIAPAVEEDLPTDDVEVSPGKDNVTPYPGTIQVGGPWTVHPFWLGQTIFVCASGPSLRDTNVELIKGRKIICVNASWELVPFASMIFFGDGRWFHEHKFALVKWPGHLVTCSGLVKSKRVLRVDRMKPVDPATGFEPNRNGVASQRTSLQGAMNLAAHLNSNDKVQGRIVLLGADMGRDQKTGISHAHKPHPWPSRPGNVTWDEQMRHLKWIVDPLRKRGIQVFNCSVQSRIPWWPRLSLEEYLKKEAGK